MRPLHLRRYLREPGPGGGFRLSWLAVLAGRPVISLQHALADQEPHGGTASRSRPPDALQRKRSRAELFTLIRRDAREHGLSARALADKHGTGKRIVRQALRSPHRPRASRSPSADHGSTRSPRSSTACSKPSRRLSTGAPARHQHLPRTRHEARANEVSYQMVRKYVGRRRPVMHHQSLSPAHQAVADHDLNGLRDLLDNGHDIEDDNGDGWSLLRRAIHAEADRHARTGQPLHADMTAFLLARGARPHEDSTGTAAEAELLGHWRGWPCHTVDIQ